MARGEAVVTYFDLLPATIYLTTAAVTGPFPTRRIDHKDNDIPYTLYLTEL
jgi:hypothetical protein